ncbi:MAG: hypothetical protein AAFY25_05950 [Pseudomonadota bacterium]
MTAASAIQTTTTLTKGQIMSAPNTNLEKQKNRHIPALLAIGGAAIFGALIFMANFGSAVDDDTETGQPLPAATANEG